MVARAVVALAGTMLAGCSASPTVRGFAGQKGLSNGDAGQRCLISPTPANRGPSAGCTKPAAQPLGQYVKFSLTIDCEVENAVNRLYYVRLPPNYDPAKAYRTVYLGPGCGPPQDQIAASKVYPMEVVSDPDAILVAMEQGFYNKAEYNIAGCVDTVQNGGSGALCHYCFDDGAGTTSPDSVEYGYFDALHKRVEEDFCVDTGNQFFAGYSSGGWMAHQLGCQFPDVLRAQGSVTGGLPNAIRDGTKTCADQPIAGFLIHDSMDQSNVYQGSLDALTRLLEVNNCTGGTTMDTAPKEPYTIPGVPNTADFYCIRFTGCPARYPIVFCTSRGKSHDAQTGAAVPGFWNFFKSLN